MKKKNTGANCGAKKKIDMQDKGARDHWLRHWGISIHQLRAAVRSTNSHEVRVIGEELRCEISDAKSCQRFDYLQQP